MPLTLNGTTGVASPGGDTSTSLTTTTLTATTVNGLTVGKGAGAVSTNTAVGASALAANTSGTQNTALGAVALATNTTSSGSTAIGWASLNLNTGAFNTAVGRSSLGSNESGANNTAIGYQALVLNTTASNNTAVGYQAAYSNTTSSNNAFFGQSAGYSFNYTGGAGYSTFIGERAGYSVTTGINNTFVGSTSGYSMTTGSKNTIIGSYGGNQGGLDIRTASNYIVLSDGDGNPRAYWSNSGNMRVPATYANTTASAANVFIDGDGLFGRSTSALKYKQDVRDLESMDISLLRPVRYKSKCEGDDQTKDHLGLIADEAAEAGFEELVSRNANGEVEGFQYERLTVVLLKSLQELNAKVDAQAAEIAALKGQA